ncbi:MAG: glycosyltransferase family 2 protein [Alphaproteobacteria bacterium]|nr:glycosyltransferase family 2 protein [Alphaproteobacteria bacterium]
MPCLNEVNTVGDCVAIASQTLQALQWRGEILVVDNGSSDSSVAAATAAGARILQVAQRGYGVAVRAGIAAAQGDYIIMGDSDLSYDFAPASLKPYLEVLDAGADLVIGNRFTGGIKPGAMSHLHRYIGTPVMTWAVNRMFGTRIGDINCGLRAFRRRAIGALVLQSDGMEFASEMVIRAAQAGLVISEVPTTLFPDGRNRKSHLRSFPDGARHLRVWVRLWLAQHHKNDPA